MISDASNQGFQGFKSSFKSGDKLYREPPTRTANASDNIGQTVPNHQNVQQNFQQNVQHNVQQTAQQQNWDKVLNNDKAGAATNAEDFTKQFMSQMGFSNANGTHQSSNHQNNG